MADRQMADRQMADWQMADRQMTGKQLIVRGIPGQQKKGRGLKVHHPFSIVTIFGMYHTSLGFFLIPPSRPDAISFIVFLFSRLFSFPIPFKRL